VPLALPRDPEADALLAVVLDDGTLPDAGVPVDDELFHGSAFGRPEVKRFAPLFPAVFVSCSRRKRVRRRRFLAAVGTAGVAASAGCGGFERSVDRQFRVGTDGFEADVGDGHVPFDVVGVNLGMGIPGRFPGEAAISRDHYDRWLRQIGELNANAIRVYTVHPPEFYEALEAFNRGRDDSIYLFQGAWIVQRALAEADSAFEVTTTFQRELRTVVDVIHGDANVPARPGTASGAFTADVSDYVAGYIAGIEWDPAVVIRTNEREQSGDYSGRYIDSTVDRPFERWLAEMLDSLVTHEVDAHGEQRPVSVPNWPTTDPLEHSHEPFVMEDAVSIDPNAFEPTDAFDAGTFASYHVYPYYPDFMNHAPEYVEYRDHRGESNSYAGYLDDLVSVTRDPLLVAEFGVPSSRGNAHRHVHGRDQGRHTEREQGEIVAAMHEDIVESGAAGGLVFTWQDEWFKRTWNISHRSDPNRRPFWSNVQTPEQRFGLLAFDPSSEIRLDGSETGWTDADRHVPSSRPIRLDDGYDGGRTLTELATAHDEAYLYLRLGFDDLGSSIDWERLNAIVALNHSDRGNTTLPLGTAARIDSADFLVRLAGSDESRIRVDPRYDAFAHEHGPAVGLDMDRYRDRDTGRFVPIRMVLNYEYTIPATDETIPSESIETGRLRYGNGNPDSPAHDSLSDVHASASHDTIELRLPWALLNVSDPSQLRALGDPRGDEIPTDRPFDGIDIAAATYRPDADGTATELSGSTNLTHAIPGLEGDQLRTVSYSWSPWNEPSSRERRKESYGIVRDAFAARRN
jgi:hypothetical protein